MFKSENANINNIKAILTGFVLSIIAILIGTKETHVTIFMEIYIVIVFTVISILLYSTFEYRIRHLKTDVDILERKYKSLMAYKISDIRKLIIGSIGAIVDIKIELPDKDPRYSNVYNYNNHVILLVVDDKVVIEEKCIGGKRTIVPIDSIRTIKHCEDVGEHEWQ